MKIQHQQLAAGKWAELSLVEQMANIGSEIERTMSWRLKGNEEISKQAFYRALELVCLSIQSTQDEARLKELCRLQETLVDYFAGDNIYQSSDKLWHNYFYAFTYAAQMQRLQINV